MPADIHISANANLSDAKVKRADASGGRSNVDVITKEGEDGPPLPSRRFRLPYLLVSFAGDTP